MALRAFLGRSADLFSWVPQRGGVVAFPHWLGNEPTSALSNRLLRDHGLRLAPSAYFARGEPHVRIGFGTAGATAGFALMVVALRA